MASTLCLTPMSGSISLFIDGRPSVCGQYEASYCITRCTVCVRRQDLHTILRYSCSVKAAQSLLPLRIAELTSVSIKASSFSIPQPLILAEIVYLCIDSSDSISGIISLSLSSNHALITENAAGNSNWSLQSSQPARRYDRVLCPAVKTTPNPTLMVPQIPEPTTGPAFRPPAPPFTRPRASSLPTLRQPPCDDHERACAVAHSSDRTCLLIKREPGHRSLLSSCNLPYCIPETRTTTTARTCTFTSLRDVPNFYAISTIH
jgi:hypothetical protein